MRQVNFDYENTCPEIDRAISDAKQQIENGIEDILYDACGLLPKETRIELALKYADTIYSSIEDAFEKTRSANEKMRSAADHQIGELKDKIESLEQQASDLERLIEEVSK